jgi:hypothetical protein
MLCRMSVTPDSKLPNPYRLVSLKPVPAPDGTADAHWHRYEIIQGENRIVGYREGRVERVTTEVDAIVMQLNERRQHQRGRVHIVLQTTSAETSAEPAPASRD